LDDDCDGAIDEGAEDAATFYGDADGDGYGSTSSTAFACTAPEGFVATGDDCDDQLATVHPGAVETCDGTDEDCDGTIDDDATDATPWHPDDDGDGYGDPSVTVLACAAPAGHTVDDTDCDDTNPNVNPLGVEVCDPWNRDEDCSGAANDDDPGVTDAQTFWPDSDGDGFGDDTLPMGACEGTPSGHVDVPGDCDDTDPEVHPSAAEQCGNDIDDDCDGFGGVCGPVGTASLSSSLGRRYGAGRLDHAGFSVAGLGDVDGDGLGDIAIGAPGFNDSSYGDEGVLYAVGGPVTGDASAALAIGTLIGGYTGDALGYSAAALGDVNGDTYADFAVSAPYTGGSESGAVYLILGPPSSVVGPTVVTGSSGAHLGISLATAGDLDGDGIQDVLAGAPEQDGSTGHTGGAYVFSGDDLSTVATITGASGGHDTGRAVAGLGDTDGDGVDDVAIASPGAGSATGEVVVFASLEGAVSSDDGVVVTGVDVGDQAGSALAGPGDVDGDGYADLLVGAPHRDTATGSAYLMLGPFESAISLSAADAELVGEAADDAAGAALAGGDLDGDGIGDLVIGAYGNDAGGARSGAVYVHYGAPSGVVTLTDVDAVLGGEAAGDLAGFAIAVAPDTDGDGYDDLLVGAYLEDTAANAAGVVYVLPGGVGF
jgi:hypothetical protein